LPSLEEAMSTDVRNAAALEGPVSRFRETSESGESDLCCSVFGGLLGVADCLGISQWRWVTDVVAVSVQRNGGRFVLPSCSGSRLRRWRAKSREPRGTGVLCFLDESPGGSLD